MSNNIQLLVIDAQNDFMDREGATLGVPGAMADSERLAQFINKRQRAIQSIHVTMDTHQQLDIAHPMFWTDSKGRQPDPFTIITADDVRNGVWRTFNPAYQKRAKAYVEALEAGQRYPLCIWPPHTLVGTWGHNIVESVYGAVAEWEQARKTRFNAVVKGHAMMSEHYSAVMAEVPDPADPTTQLNRGLIETLEEADTLFITGQALSHCVANTVTDVANNISEDAVKKMVLIEDTSSPVPGFESLATDFLSQMKARGMQTVKASEIDI